MLNPVKEIERGGGTDGELPYHKAKLLSSSKSTRKRWSGGAAVSSESSSKAAARARVSRSEGDSCGLGLKEV